MSTRDFLVEIGTEELPPKSLFTLAEAFAKSIDDGLTAAGISHGSVEWFATPRRLAVRISQVVFQQPDQAVRRQGPSIAQAFDKAGAPTKAALGFAASCGVPFESLEQVDGPKGRVLQYVGTKRGEATTSLLPGIVSSALAALPIARRMRSVYVGAMSERCTPSRRQSSSVTCTMASVPPRIVVTSPRSS